MTSDLRLSEAQERSIAHATARINLWSGAVRSGKTIASLLRWLIYVSQAPRGGQLAVTGKTFDTVSRNVFGPLMDPAITGNAAKHVKYTRGAPTGTILGREVEVITANDERAEGRLRGMTCAGAYVDEATLLPESFWQQLLARLSVPGAQLFATTNPDGPAHWLRKKFILRAGELDMRHWHFTLDDNPGLDPAYVAALKREYVGLWYRRFILGKWVLAQGAIYDMWDEDLHVVSGLPHIERWLSCGVDYGTVNPFAAGLIGVGVDNRLYVTNEWRHESQISMRGQMTDEQYSKALREWFDGIERPHEIGGKGVWPEYLCIDPSAASFRAQLFRDGFNPTRANNEVLDGIRTTASLLAADRLKVHVSCTGLIEEMPGYSWDDDAAEKGEDKPVKAEDHSCDYLRYGVKTPESIWRPYIDLPLPEAA